MKNSTIKTGLVGLLGLLASTAWADVLPFSLSDTDGSTLQWEVASPTIRINFDAPFQFTGGSLDLRWTPGIPADALALEPMLLTGSGPSWPTLAPQLDTPVIELAGTTGDGVSVFVATKTLEPVTVSGPLTINLALRGNAVGVYTVSYTVTLLDQDMTPFLLGDSFKVTVSAVPEPASWALLLGGLVGVAALARRRAQAAG